MHLAPGFKPISKRLLICPAIPLHLQFKNISQKLMQRLGSQRTKYERITASQLHLPSLAHVLSTIVDSESSPSISTGKFGLVIALGLCSRESIPLYHTPLGQLNQYYSTHVFACFFPCDVGQHQCEIAKSHILRFIWKSFLASWCIQWSDFACTEIGVMCLLLRCCIITNVIDCFNVISLFSQQHRSVSALGYKGH